MGSRRPKNRPKRHKKDHGVERIVQKNRRNDRWNGCMRDLNRICCDIKLRVLKRREVICMIGDMVVGLRCVFRVGFGVAVGF